MQRQLQQQSSPAWYADRSRWRLVLTEVGITAALMAAYFLLRGIRPDDIGGSVNRSLQIIHFEQQLGIFAEASWQSAFVDNDILMKVANFVYAWMHYPVMFAVAVWLVVKDPVQFRFVRKVLMVSAIIGIAVYWLMPAAPPRLMDLYGYDFGFVDTVHGATSDVTYFQPGPFVNDYAALPSFHFGWIALSSAAIWVNTKNPIVRGIAISMSILMWWAVTVTGNHFFIDMVFGALVVAFSWALVSFSEQFAFRDWLRYISDPVRHRLRS